MQSEHFNASIMKNCSFLGGGKGMPSARTLDWGKSSSVNSSFFPGIEILFPACGW